MQTTLECFSCFMKSAVRTLRTFTSDSVVSERLGREILGVLAHMDLARTPPEMGAEIERHIFAALGLTDPYAPLRSRYNQLIGALLPRLREEVAASPDPFEHALRLAVGGNIIDFGNEYTMTEELAHESLASSLTDPFHLGTPDALRALVDGAREILYIGDNCGEIVLDRLFMETVGPARFTFAVRGGPILNDVLLSDAVEVGLSGLIPVVETGQALPGVLPETASPAFREVWERADLIIAKGQGNYETLSETTRPVAFALKAKCSVVAADLAVPPGSMVLRLPDLTLSRRR